MTQLHLDPKLTINETGKYGKGVFAGEDITKGRRIHILGGEPLPLSDMLRRVLSGAESVDDALQVGRRTYIDLDKTSRLFNHSCDPNAGIKKVSELFALRNIMKGEEITFDYSVTVSPTEWEMRCQCGSRKCRGILGDVLTVPKDQMYLYKTAGALQNYMKALLKEIESGHYRIPRYEILALEKLKRHKG